MAKNKWKAMVSECMPAMAANLNIGKEHLGSAKGKQCFFCATDAVENEHLLEKSKGGSNLPANVVPVCHAHRKASGVTNERLYTQAELDKIAKHWQSNNGDHENPMYNQHAYYAAIMRRYIIDAQNQMLEDFPELQEYFEFQNRDFAAAWLKKHGDVYKKVNEVKP